MKEFGFGRTVDLSGKQPSPGFAEQGGSFFFRPSDEHTLALLESAHSPSPLLLKFITAFYSGAAI
jgi:hypothetical protein